MVCFWWTKERRLRRDGGCGVSFEAAAVHDCRRRAPYPCCADAAEAYSRASWFDAAYVGSGSCSCIIPKGSDLGITGGASSAIDICAADVLV